MSITRRYFDKQKIFDFGRMFGFYEFNRSIVNSDIYVANDPFSEWFLNLYFNTLKDYRFLLYESLAKEQEFVVDLVKCLSVCKNPLNKDEHQIPIKRYVSLFNYKWPKEAPGYRHLLN